MFIESTTQHRHYYDLGECCKSAVGINGRKQHCTFFENTRLVYWDLTLRLFVLQLCNIVYDTPKGQVGFGGNERNPSFLVRDDQRMTLYGKVWV